MAPKDSSAPDRLRVAVLFHRLGPYHHARLRAAAARLSLVAVEFSAADRTYAWDAVARADAFKQVTLFDDKEIDDQPLLTVMGRMARVLFRLRPDVVAIPGWSSRGALAALAWCRMTRTPAIVMSASTMRDHVRTPRREFVKRLVLRFCAGGLAGGTAQEDYLVALGMPRNRICVGYDVVDNDHFAAKAEAARGDAAALRAARGLPQRFFMSSSRFVPKKNLHRLVRAYAAYRKQAGPDAWGLVLVGDGPETPRLRDFVVSEGLEGDVLLPGFKQYDDLPVYYGLAEVFVLASTSEQWGLVVNEAMAAGLPVLVSRQCGCAPDLVKEGGNGFTFEPEDEAALTALLAHMASPGCDRAAMGAASRQIIQRWSPATFADALLAAARRVRGAPPPAASAMGNPVGLQG